MVDVRMNVMAVTCELGCGSREKIKSLKSRLKVED